MSAKIKVEVEMGVEHLESLLCSAFEGGSNYWCTGVKPVKASEFKNATGTWLHEAIARGEISEIKVYDAEEDMHRVVACDAASLAFALRRMAAKYPRHFMDELTGNGDATTGDVFFQCLVFGEVIYG